MKITPGTRTNSYSTADFHKMAVNSSRRELVLFTCVTFNTGTMSVFRYIILQIQKIDTLLKHSDDERRTAIEFNASLSDDACA